MHGLSCFQSDETKSFATPMNSDDPLLIHADVHEPTMKKSLLKALRSRLRMQTENRLHGLTTYEDSWIQTVSNQLLNPQKTIEQEILTAGGDEWNVYSNLSLKSYNRKLWKFPTDKNGKVFQMAKFSDSPQTIDSFSMSCLCSHRLWQFLSQSRLNRGKIQQIENNWSSINKLLTTFDPIDAVRLAVRWWVPRGESWDIIKIYRITVSTLAVNVFWLIHWRRENSHLLFIPQMLSCLTFEWRITSLVSDRRSGATRG